MPTIADIRQQYPQYNDMSDGALADALYKKFYSDMPRQDFDAKVGVKGDAPDAGVTTDNVVRQVASGVPVIGGLLNRANAATYAALSPLVPSDTTVSQAPSFGERYAENLRRENAKDQGFEVAHPALSTGLQMAGGVAGTLPLVAAAPAAFGAGSAPLAIRAGASAATGAALGGADAAARGQDVSTGAGAGALLGGFSPYAAAGIGKAVGGVAGYLKPAVTPSIDDLKAAAQAAYQRADDAGVVYSKDAMQRVANDLRQQFYDFGYHPELQGGAKVALGEMERLADQNVTLKGLDTARKIAGNAFQPGNKANNALTAKVTDAIDNLAANPQAGDILVGDGPAASAALNEARALWASKAKAEMVRDAVKRAENRALSTGSGGNIDNTIRQNLRAILDNPKKSRGFTPDELAALQNAVATPSRVVRTVGKLAPNGNGLMTMLQLGGAYGTGGATIPLAIIGTAAKSVADKATRVRADVLARTILNGGTTPASPLGLSSRAKAEALARALLSPAPLYANQRR